MSIKRLHYQILSDVHIERQYPTVPSLESIITQQADTLILAGDIGRLDSSESTPFGGSLRDPDPLGGYFGQYTQFLTRIQDSGFKRVFLILGNHERLSCTNLPAFMIMKLVEFLHTTPKITLLENQSVDIEGNIRIYGTVLWTHIPDESYGLQTLSLQTMDRHPADASWINREHFNLVYQLENVIAKAKEDDKRLIVVSHHAPTMIGTLGLKYANDPKRFYYANNMDRLLTKDQVYVWIFGHTHVNCDYLSHGNTRVVSNQYQGAGYDATKICDVKHKVAPIVRTADYSGCGRHC